VWVRVQRLVAQTIEIPHRTWRQVLADMNHPSAAGALREVNGSAKESIDSNHPAEVGKKRRRVVTG
jgi:hypothetical protein